MIAAHKAVKRKIYSGDWPKASELLCSVCGKQADDYHHHLGYEQQHWYDVIPICRSCHRRITSEANRATFWTEGVCLHCSNRFPVRKCYTKRGQGKFCSASCGITWRNLRDNPVNNLEVRAKISANHADVSMRKRIAGRFV